MYSRYDTCRARAVPAQTFRLPCNDDARARDASHNWQLENRYRRLLGSYSSTAAMVLAAYCELVLYAVICMYVITSFVCRTQTPGGAFSGQSVLRAFGEVRPDSSMGAAPISISGLTSSNAPTEGCELDVPRLAALRGRARARARGTSGVCMHDC